MKTWTDNLIQFNKTKSPGNCPICNSNHVKAEEYHEGRYSVTLRCEDCGSWDHFDGALEKRN